VQLKIVAVVLLLTLSAIAEDHTPKPIDCSQLLTWMAGGIPNQRLARLVRERGVAFRVGENTAKVLSTAGAGIDLMNEIRSLDTTLTDGQNADCPAELADAAKLVHQQDYDEAETIVRKRLAATPDNADLHLALGYIRTQHGDVDEAFDDYSDAKDLNPEFPEIHSGLSYVFYCSNDYENAIAEARTALSIDPHNAEAYRYLGLGLYAGEKYAAALHAFRQSLALDPNRAETYYDSGLAQAAEKNLAAAAESYQKAIRLNPDLREARTKLRLVLRELGQSHAAVAEDQPSQPNTPARR
jgi:tetratricopeptide (TPR) repeat protein